MGYRLGVDLGTSFTAATIGRAGGMQGASLGVDSAVVPSVVYIGADGERLYGSAAAERAGDGSGRVLRGFVRRIGDETPMVPEAGAATAAHRVTADFVAWVVAQASVQEGRAPESVAVTHPATWGPHKRELLATALREAGVIGATLVAESVAAATAGMSGRHHTAESVVAVYDLGGRTFDAALARREASGAWTSVGRPAGLPDFGGTDLDDLVFAHVVSSLTPDQQQALEALDAEDEATGAALAGLRAACAEAKEILSAETATTIEVKLPGITTNVRLTRAEFEAMITPALEATIDVLDAVVDGAGLVPADLTYIVTSGGTSRIPLVTQLLSRQFHVPVVSADAKNPATAVAAGAVLALDAIAPAAAPAPAVPPIVAPIVAKVARKTKRVPAPAKPVGPQGPAQAAKPADARPAGNPLPAQPANVHLPAQPTAEHVMPAAASMPAPPVPAQPAPAQPVPAQPAPAQPEAPVAEMPLPNPSAPSSKPIRPRRNARRSEIVGLEGLASAAPAARAAEAPELEGPRAVVPARAIRSVDALLVEERVLTPRSEDQFPPPRPALDDFRFDHIDDAEIEQLVAGWSWRSLFSVRRTLALTVLTSAIYVGSTAWIPATPAITEAPSSTLKVASAPHAQR